MTGTPLTPLERAKWLRLIRTENVGAITFFQLIKRFGGDLDTIFDALPGLMSKSGKSRQLNAPPMAVIEDEIARAEKLGVRYLASCEPEYPAPMAAMNPPPPVIAIRGRMDVFARPGVAIVGARNASAAGRKIARDMARDLSDAGYTIVSGMARGIDGEAHAAALANKATIAVLAGGATSIYPPEHDKLYAEIVEKGAIVTEAPFGYVAQARDFPKRNRLITGLSIGVVVVEAAKRSGSLISARVALEQGREVMAVPGSPLDERTRGSNGLLKQGAWLVENAQDVIQALENAAPPPMLAESSSPAFDAAPLIAAPLSQLDALRMALSPTPMHVDELARVVGVSVREIHAALTELELSGFAETHAGGMANRVAEA